MNARIGEEYARRADAICDEDELQRSRYGRSQATESESGEIIAAMDAGTVVGDWFRTDEDATLWLVSEQTGVSMHDLVVFNHGRTAIAGTGRGKMPKPRATPCRRDGSPRTYSCTFQANTWLKLNANASDKDTIRGSEVLEQDLGMPHMEFRRDDHIGSVKLLRKRDYHQGSRDTEAEEEQAAKWAATDTKKGKSHERAARPARVGGEVPPSRPGCASEGVLRAEPSNS
jgi:hypothetical protein